MNIQRALIWGIVYLVVSNLLGRLFYISPWQAYMSKIFLVLAPILTLVFAYLYFRESTVKSKFVEGLGVGVIWVLMGVVFDAIFVVWMYTQNFADYFTSWQVWVGYLEMVILVLVVSLVFQLKTRE